MKAQYSGTSRHAQGTVPQVKGMRGHRPDMQFKLYTGTFVDYHHLSSCSHVQLDFQFSSSNLMAARNRRGLRRHEYIHMYIAGTCMAIRTIRGGYP